MAASLPYHEPSVLTILILSSFLLGTNIVNHLLDNAIYCGLIGQLFMGVAYGSPGGNLLGPEVEHTIVQLGYLGLLLIVYEGMSNNSIHTMGKSEQLMISRWAINIFSSS